MAQRRARALRATPAKAECRLLRTSRCASGFTGARARQPSRLLRRELNGDLVRHGLGQLALQAEHVGRARGRSGRPTASGRRAPRRAARSRARGCRRGAPSPRGRRRRSARARSRAASVSEPLYRIADVREMTRSALMRARSEMIASVMPSAKYSCAGSRDTLRSGSTAMRADRLRAVAGACSAHRAADDARSAAAHRGRRRGALRRLLRQAGIDELVQRDGHLGAERAQRRRRVAEDLEHQRLAPAPSRTGAGRSPSRTASRRARRCRCARCPPRRAAARAPCRAASRGSSRSA